VNEINSYVFFFKPRAAPSQRVWVASLVTEIDRQATGASYAPNSCSPLLCSSPVIWRSRAGQQTLRQRAAESLCRQGWRCWTRQSSPRLCCCPTTWRRLPALPKSHKRMTRPSLGSVIRCNLKEAARYDVGLVHSSHAGPQYERPSSDPADCHGVCGVYL